MMPGLHSPRRTPGASLLRRLVTGARARTAVAVLAIGVGASACGDDDGSGPTQLTGRYDLVAVDGEPLPALIFSDPDFGASLSVISGSLTFIDAATVRFGLRWRVEYEDGSPDEEDGNTSDLTYSRNGNQLRFFDEADDEVFTAVLDRNTITATAVDDETGDTLVLRFVKQ